MRKSNQNRAPNSLDLIQEINIFHQSEHREISNLIAEIEKVEDELKDKHDECEAYLNQIAGKRRQNQRFGNISKGVLQGKAEEIKSKTKNIDSVSTGVKQSVAKIKVDRLSKLPVTQERTLTKLFKTLYKIVYNERNEFDWETFNDLVLKHEGGEDFVFRLVNFNFKDVESPKYGLLMELKSDPEFEKVATKSIYGKDIIDLADWIDYVCLGHRFSEEKKKLEKQYQRIRKDADKKSKGSLQVSESFWKEASQQIDRYHNELRNLSSELKAITFEMKRCGGDSDTKTRVLGATRTSHIRA